MLMQRLWSVKSALPASHVVAACVAAPLMAAWTAYADATALVAAYADAAPLVAA